MDQRTILTEQAIRTAFFELMSQDGFEKISVRDLTERAGINRTTFYLHHCDKYELLNTIEDELLEGIATILAELPLKELPRARFSKKLGQKVLAVLRHIEKNHFSFSILFGTNGDPNFIIKYGNVMRALIPQINASLKALIPVDYILAIVIGAHTSLIREWITSGMKESPEEMAKFVTKIIYGIAKSFFTVR